jgi:hypothetical protein
MEIWHYHPQTGTLLGQGAADPSPAEPGAWLIPAFATTAPPPAADEGREAAWNGGAWVLRDVPPPAPPEPPAPPAPPPAPIRAIRTYAFRQRLPVQTRQTITLAAAAAMRATPGDATLQTWLDDLSSTGTVLLDAPELQAGVAALLGAGLITAAERDALLADGSAEEV